VFDRILTWFANLWFAFALLCMVVDISMIIYTAPSIWSGVEAGTDKWSTVESHAFYCRTDYCWTDFLMARSSCSPLA
jgi:hypothetical protein